MKSVYLDYNSTTPVAPEVLDAMLPYFSREAGNASSIHSPGQRARAAVERARAAVAELLGARPAEIVFTSGGTESDNLAIRGIVAAATGSPKHVISTQIEHHAVLNTCQALERDGVEVTYVPVSAQGVVDPDAIRRALRPETVLISVMHANNELGTVQPVEEIGKIAAEADVYFHVDAVQSAGKLPIRVDEIGADLLSISAHKIRGPKGVGALYVRKGTRLRPLFYGGHHERDRRPGTENVPGIVGLGRAAELAAANLAADAARVRALRDRLERELIARVPHTRVNGAGAPRTPNTANIVFPFVEGEALVIALDLKGMACSTGAACSAGAVEPSHVLTAIGLAPEDARASLRFSLGHDTTDDDIDYAIQVIPAAVEHLRELSPVYQKPAAVK
jgi:cysteine desulfurase